MSHSIVSTMRILSIENNWPLDLPLPVPLSKNCSSVDNMGRGPSMGMQYLSERLVGNLCKEANQDTRLHATDLLAQFW